MDQNKIVAVMDGLVWFFCFKFMGFQDTAECTPGWLPQLLFGSKFGIMKAWLTDREAQNKDSF